MAFYIELPLLATLFTKWEKQR